ncbi:DUF2528 family protein [Vibrio sp.]|nr:DUF2528 family protein [Vibrio sp.]
MVKQVKISSGAWQKDMEMKITIVDEAKFNKECEEINKFFMDDEYRRNRHGSHIKAGLAMFAAECFQQMAFNNFKDEKWLAEQFDWSKGKGVEGYPSIEDLGITIDDVESWFIDSDEIEISGL